MLAVPLMLQLMHMMTGIGQVRADGMPGSDPGKPGRCVILAEEREKHPFLQCLGCFSPGFGGSPQAINCAGRCGSIAEASFLQDASLHHQGKTSPVASVFARLFGCGSA